MWDRWDSKKAYVFILAFTKAFTSNQIEIFTAELFSGVHVKTSNCNPAETARTIRSDLEKAKDFTFPENLPVTEAFDLHNPRVNGGWGDPRDHQLCLMMSETNTLLLNSHAPN